jgi:hypothetical protein
MTTYYNVNIADFPTWKAVSKNGQLLVMRCAVPQNAAYNNIGTQTIISNKLMVFEIGSWLLKSDNGGEYAVYCAGNYINCGDVIGQSDIWYNVGLIERQAGIESSSAIWPAIHAHFGREIKRAIVNNQEYLM